MLPIRQLSLLLLGFLSTGAAVPLQGALPEDSSAIDHGNVLVKRGSCHAGEIQIASVRLLDTHLLLCLGPRTVKVGVISIGGVAAAAGISYVVNQVYPWVKSDTVGSRSTTITKDVKRRQIGELDSSDEEEELLYVRVGGVEAGLPFVRDQEGKTTIDISDFLARSSPSLDTRDLSESEATVTGGSATYLSNGTLDTFTLDFSASTPSVPVESSSNASTSSARLSKRGRYVLHTTYWATAGHEHTSLSDDKLRRLISASFTDLPGGPTDACGYMGNSGTWHGAFRHWTGDQGYSVGECQAERAY